MSIKGKIARFYNDKPKAVNLFWILAQIVSLLFVIAGICVLFLAPGYTAMGIVMKIYDVFVIALVSFMFIYKKCNKKMLETNELYIGYYIGLCMMTCMNLVIIAVLYGSQSNLVEIVNGRPIAKTFYRLIASFAIFDIFFYVLYAYFSIRYHNDILAANRPAKASKPAPPEKPEKVATAETPNPPPRPTMLALPAPPSSEANNQLVLARPQEKKDSAIVPANPAKPAGLLPPPGISL